MKLQFLVIVLTTRLALVLAMTSAFALVSVCDRVVANAIGVALALVLLGVPVLALVCL